MPSLKISIPAAVARRFPAQSQDRQRQLSNQISIVLKATRMQRGFDQEEVAQRLGWTRSMVANLENGRKEVTLVDLAFLAEALDIDLTKLIHRILQW